MPASTGTTLPSVQIQDTAYKPDPETPTPSLGLSLFKMELKRENLVWRVKNWLKRRGAIQLVINMSRQRLFQGRSCLFRQKRVYYPIVARQCFITQQLVSHSLWSLQCSTKDTRQHRNLCFFCVKLSFFFFCFKVLSKMEKVPKIGRRKYIYLILPSWIPGWLGEIG